MARSVIFSPDIDAEIKKIVAPICRDYGHKNCDEAEIDRIISNVKRKISECISAEMMCVGDIMPKDRAWEISYLRDGSIVRWGRSVNGEKWSYGGFYDADEMLSKSDR